MDYDDYNIFDEEPATPEDFIATAGEDHDLKTGPIASKDDVIEALHTVFDPEIPVDIYELGLIYTIDIKDNGTVDITMSLTSPGCPVAGEMPGDVARTVAKVSGIGKVTVQLVWDPMWSPELMSDDARLMLGFFE